MRILTTLIFLPLFVLSSACDRSEIDSDPTLPNIRTLQAYERDLVTANTDFALRMFQILAQDKEGNMFFSPYSVHQALGMTMNGNTGDILTEYMSVLGFDEMSLDKANRAAKELTEFLLAVDSNVKTDIANGIWYRKGLVPQSSFREAVQKFYDAELAALDMTNPQSTDIINRWVKVQTNGIIDELIDEVSPDAVMYLVNAIYFKGDWKYQFPRSKTRKDRFYTNPQNSIEVDMMSLDSPADFRVSGDQEVIYLELPYSTGQYSMAILFSEHADIDEVVARVTPERLEQFRSQARERAFYLSFPKFTFRQRIDNLQSVLENMGLITPFQQHPDNFSELFEGSSSGMQISRVIHEAFIEVDEVGTEAAAATAVEVVLTNAGPADPPRIKVDRPFVFLIQEAHSGAILFMGKIRNPNG